MMSNQWTKKEFYRVVTGLIVTTVVLCVLAGILWTKGYGVWIHLNRKGDAEVVP